jgi:hypothetical protein
MESPNPMSLPSPQSSFVRFNADGTLFTLKSDFALQNLGLFRGDPSRINSTEYKVATVVPPAVFDAFL